MYSVRIPSETMHASQMVPRKIARDDAITTKQGELQEKIDAQARGEKAVDVRRASPEILYSSKVPTV